MIFSRRNAIAIFAAGMAVRPSRLFAQPAMTTIRVSSPAGASVVPLVYAMRAGLFERAGIDLQYTKVPTGAVAASALAGGAIDIAVSAVLVIISGHAHGVPFTIIAPTESWLPSSDGGLLVNTSSPLRVARDFNGKTIAVQAVNDINVVAMKAWMDQNGGDSSSLKFIELPQLAAPAALEQGRIDGITVANPAFTIATSDGKARLVDNIYTSIAPRLLVGAYFSTTDWVSHNRDAAARFARVIADASLYVNAHSDEATGYVADFTGLDRGLLTKMRRTAQPTVVHAAELQPFIDAAAKYKIIDTSFPANDIIADTALR
jgi:NitT/TauT family transport system substrate-binding protein